MEIIQSNKFNDLPEYQRKHLCSRLSLRRTLHNLKVSEKEYCLK